MRHRFLLAVCLAFCAAAGAADSTYPTRPVRLIVGYPPGGSTDIAARMIGQRLAPVFNQTVVIDNRAGASGTIGAGIVVKGDPDGHTLSFAASPEVAIYRALMKNPPYDSLKDFVPVTLVGRVPFMLVIHPSVAANSVRELVALAKAKPGALNFASFGNGTSNHLVGAAFCAAAGINIVHIPSKGSAPARQIVLQRPDATQFPMVLRFGNPEAESPNYDFARNLPEALPTTPVRGVLGAADPNPAYVAPPMPFTERFPWFIYVALSSVSVALGVVVKNLSKAAIANHDAASGKT